MMVHDLKQKNCLFSDEILPNKIVSAWARRDLNSPVREESPSAQPLLFDSHPVHSRNQILELYGNTAICIDVYQHTQICIKSKHALENLIFTV